MHSQSHQPEKIPEGHLLERMFHGLTEASFGQLGVSDSDLMLYVADLLIEFIHVDNFYRVRNANGERLQYLYELQLESRKGDFDRVRATQKHLGDYALFTVGLFPESLQRRRRAVSPSYYVAQGKQAYATVSKMDDLQISARLFRKLATCFETCVSALNIQKDMLSDEVYRYLMRQMFS